MMKKKDFQQIKWCPAVEDDFRTILDQAVREDVESVGDLTSQATVPEDTPGFASIISRSAGVFAGEPTVKLICSAVSSDLKSVMEVKDGEKISAGQRIGSISGPARAILQAERLVLNFLARLSGVATMTNLYVEAVSGTGASVYDTRKTLPGWRLLDKYAVQCGGGKNHRSGLYEAILIKDNHLALAAGQAGLKHFDYNPAEAVQKVREFLRERDEKGSSVSLRPDCTPRTCRTRAAILAAVAGATGSPVVGEMISQTPCYMIARAREKGAEVPREPATNFPAQGVIIEVEVDTLKQYELALSANPDIILLDNMTPEMLRTAVEMRNAHNSEIELEASGGITLANISEVAKTGVERISVGALTHSVTYFDLGLDWE
ncbi:MAG: nicotinate-nucleotide diphosphorylase [Planctomycetia bacterium]|nr:nicotinate-nucleotide diphosphorylase [Planctomycetia bacterium]